MDASALLLSRLQFGFTISFHIIFPAFSIGLAAWLAVLEAKHLWTGNAVYRTLFQFWLKIFGVAFGLGVVSGVVMAFQFGTNWSVLSNMSGPIQGPLLSYETFTAFALEAGFFGVLILGRQRVAPWFYFFSTAVVAFGTTLSAFWIMVNNSWMQVPVGYVVQNGQFVPDDWTKIIFNSVVWSRFPHMLLASYLTGAFCVASSGAWYLLRDKSRAEALVMLRMGLVLAAVLMPVQLAFGHLVGDYSTTFSRRSSRRSRAAGTMSSRRARADRVARSGTRDQQIRNQDPGTRKHCWQHEPDVKGGRTNRFLATGSSAGAHPVCNLTHHGRLRIDHARACLAWLLSDRQAPPRAKPPSPLVHLSKLSPAVHCHPHGMVHG
jgi:hypothetical protein